MKKKGNYEEIQQRRREKAERKKRGTKTPDDFQKTLGEPVTRTKYERSGETKTPDEKTRRTFSHSLTTSLEHHSRAVWGITEAKESRNRNVNAEE